MRVDKDLIVWSASVFGNKVCLEQLQAVGKGYRAQTRNKADFLKFKNDTVSYLQITFEKSCKKCKKLRPAALQRV